MKLRLLALAALLALVSFPSDAQTVRVVPSCGGLSLKATDSSGLVIDVNGNLCTAAVAVPAGGMSGGLSTYRVMTAASSAAVTLKSGAGRLYSYHLCNNAAATRYVRFYNSAAATTGTTAVFAGAITLSAATCQTFTTNFGLTFSAGISMSITAANGDADATSPAAGDVSGFIGYL